MNHMLGLFLIPVVAAFQPPICSCRNKPLEASLHSYSPRANEHDTPKHIRLDDLESDIFDIDDFNDSRYSGLNRSESTVVTIEKGLRWIPMLIPVLAYVMYDPTAASFASILDSLANNNFVAVDGGAYQAKIIAPAINGVVVPAISILFANLIGTTITTLRQRQLDIRTAINMEAGQLRILQSLLDVIPNPKEQQLCWQYLTQYTSRLIAESQPTIQISTLDGSLDTELNGVLGALNRLAVIADKAATTSKTELDDVAAAPSGLVLDKAYGSCTKLFEERAKRITALRSFFPTLHYVIVSTLAVSICVAFLLESNQDLLMFLNAIQLRILWTMLVGTFSALAIVCYDLGNPFRGSYQISKSVDQLYTIRLALQASMSEMSRRQDKQERSTHTDTREPIANVEKKE